MGVKRRIKPDKRQSMAKGSVNSELQLQYLRAVAFNLRPEIKKPTTAMSSAFFIAAGIRRSAAVAHWLLRSPAELLHPAGKRWD